MQENRSKRETERKIIMIMKRRERDRETRKIH